MKTNFLPLRTPIRVLNTLSLVALSMYSGVVVAQEASPETCIRDEVTKIYYTNGVNNSRAEARASLRAIQDAYQSDLESQYPDQKFEFRLAYNQTYGLMADLTEVAIQRASGLLFTGVTKRELGQLMNLNKKSLRQLKQSAEAMQNERMILLTTAALEASEDEDRYQEIYGDLLTDIRQLTEGQKTESSEIIYQEYKRGLMAGDRVIVFAHSQGNLFANQAVEHLQREKSEWSESIGIINVANPDSRVLNGSFCVTADDDRVIQALAILESVADCDIDNDQSLNPFERDASNHGFLDAYFAEGLPSRASIDGFLEALVAGLKFPEAELSDGALRASLEWNGSQDIDLHIAEPNGQIVYYGSRVGQSGELDRDDTDGYGPENYFVSCDSLEEGTYQFIVKFYSGSGSTNATLSLSTFTGSTSRAMALLTSSGDQEMLFEVTVSKVDGRFKFEINNFGRVDSADTVLNPSES